MVKQLRNEVYHSPEVKNEWLYTSTPPTGLHGVQRENFFFTPAFAYRDSGNLCASPWTMSVGTLLSTHISLTEDTTQHWHNCLYKCYNIPRSRLPKIPLNTLDVCAAMPFHSELMLEKKSLPPAPRKSRPAVLLMSGWTSSRLGAGGVDWWGGRADLCMGCCW